MLAKHAKALTKRAETLAQKRKAQKLTEEEKKRKTENDRYMRDEYPKFEAKVYAEIRQASKSGISSIRVVDPRGIAWDRLSHKLESDGYSIQTHYVEGEMENMGDFNAPCNIWRDPYRWYEVSW